MIASRERILIVALPGIGDALLATPMIELLRKAKPQAEIHALVMFHATSEMLEHDPCIDVVHYHDFVHGSKASSLNVVRRLRQLRFDVSINIYPQNRREYNLIAMMIGARRRLGIRYLRRDKQNLNWLNSDWVWEDDRYHCVEENVRLLRPLGVEPSLSEAELPPLRLTLSDDHLHFADRWLDEHGVSADELTIGFHAGTALFKNHVRRRWAPEKFAELARVLTAELGARVLLFGGPDDVTANDVILAEAGEHITFVKTRSILDSVAVMQRLKLFVSNDSSLMHIAGALSLPTVAIFGPTNETYVHPWKTRYEIVQTGIECRPCFVYSPKPLTCYRVNPSEHYICVREIGVGDVHEAVMRLLSQGLQLPVI